MSSLLINSGFARTLSGLKAEGIPVPGDGRKLGEYDLLVVGASLAGLAAAIGAAESGASVLVVENSISPAPEIFDALALNVSLEVQRGWAVVLGLDVPIEARGLHPARWKCALEERLGQAGVKLLYSLTPFAWISDACGWKIALSGKTGRWWARAASVVEATPDPVFAGRFGHKEWPLVAPVRRRIEFMHVAMEKLEARTAAHGIGKNSGWTIEHGPAHPSHVFVDVSWGHAGEFADGMETAAAVAARLKEEHPAFRHAQLISIARLDLPELTGRHAEVLPVETERAGYWRLPKIGLPSDEALAAIFAARIPPGSRDQRHEDCGHLPVESRRVDVLVVGGGTCGASAAVAAGEAGVRTLLAEMHPGFGGIGTIGGINSYWFGYRSGHNARITRRLRKRDSAEAGEAIPHSKMRIWNVEQKKMLLREMVVKAGVEASTGTQFVAALCEGRRVAGAWLLREGKLLRVDAGVTVDATGDGDVAADAGVPYDYGAPKTGSTMWFTLVWLESPGNYRSNFTSSVDVGNAWDFTRAVLSGRRRGCDAWDHASSLSTRESRHVRTDVRLTLTDQLLNRQWRDTVSLAYSNHDVKGYTESPWLRVGLIPPNLQIEVPLRALIPKDWEGLLVTGKALGATSDGLPAIRMQADFENLGYATGLAAAMAASSHQAVRSVSIRELQEHLVEIGNLPAEILGRRIRRRSLKDRDIQRFVSDLDDSISLQRFQDMKKGDVWHGAIPFVEVVMGGDRSKSHLIRAVRDKESPRRRMAARALAMLGCAEAASVLVTEAWEHLGERGLPERSQPLHYAQAPPDQANMPELAYLLNALAMTCSPLALPVLTEVVDRIEPTEEKLRSSTSGLFDYVDAVCSIAESLSSPRVIPALRRLHGHSLWSQKPFRGWYQADWFEERKAFLEIRICAARLACGDAPAFQRLTDYMRDSRRPLARHAHLAIKRMGKKVACLPTLRSSN